MVERDGIPFDVAVQSLFRVQPIRVYNEDRNYADAGLDDHIQCVVFDQSAFADEMKQRNQNGQLPRLSIDRANALINAAEASGLESKYQAQLQQFVDFQTQRDNSSPLSSDVINDRLSKLSDSLPKLSMDEIRNDNSNVCICKGFALKVKPESPLIGDKEWSDGRDITLKIAAESSKCTLPSLISVKKLTDEQHRYLDRFLLECAEDKSEFASIIGTVINE